MTETELDTRPGPPAPSPLVWAFAAVFLLFEGVFQLADAGILPWPDLRWEGYLQLAFFDVLFEAWLAGADVPSIAYTGLLTHAFVHGGMVHVLFNTVIFLALGGTVAHVLGSARFVVLFIATALGGVLTYAAISDFEGPLVGASGVVFGLIGALKMWEWRWIRATGAPANRFWGTIIGLTIINAVLALWYPLGGGLAWEAHLGGFLAGMLAGGLLAPGVMGRSPI